MFQSINPYTLEKVYEVKEFDKSEVEKAIDRADERYNFWRETSLKKRAKLMYAAATELRKNSTDYATAITDEMGKPITQALAEVEKCALVCEYYAENAEEHLRTKIIETEATQSYVRYDPIGVVLAVMPWNYPLWQVFRFAAPALMAGNVGLLKHASNVMKCADNIERVFKNAGFPEGCFTNLPIRSSMVEDIIRNEKVKAVTLTGSELAGKSVASIAGSEIKKSVLELGGSNALVIFDDCNLDETVKVCVNSRFQNAGQSCIAGKRLLVQASIVEKFTENFLSGVKSLKPGNPLEMDTTIGTMARIDLAEELEEKLKLTLKQGGKLLTGGVRKNAYFEPTVVANVTESMSIFTDETFGPLIGITVFKDEDEAIKLANISRYGLGTSIFSEDMEKIMRIIPQLDDGSVFVNELVKSDPRLPFGGTKLSGYGRELSIDGIQEFVNKKTVFIR